MAENGGLEAAEFKVRRDFCGDKGAATRIWQVWQGIGRRGGSII